MNNDTTINHVPAFNNYFENGEVSHEFKKEFVTLWPEWLGEENYHKLDEVTKPEWGRFNLLIRNISKQYKLLLVNLKEKTISKINDLEKTLASYDDSRNKSSNEFSVLIIPYLDCILTEDWDYTYIIWYRNKKAVERLDPIITESELYHFSE
ncbi:MAG: hypothetical protein EOP00_02645 [Pedobacter sp.]|nr:MAG: hypothetical protein EOP00_02645 [Pedobacter sp.]